MGAIINKGLTLRTARQHGQAYVPRVPRPLGHAARGELDPSYLATDRSPLEDAVRGYDMFEHRTDGCVRAVFTP